VAIAGTVVRAVRRLTGSSTSLSAGSWRHRQQLAQQQEQGQQQAVVPAAVVAAAVSMLHQGAKVPVASLYNNPSCTCMSGASELQLVGGNACVCGGCRVER
jgi:Ca2+/H+ antiporter